MTDELYDITDTSRNERELLSRKPKSGRLIKEDFSVVNIADAIDTTSPLTPKLRAVIS